ncbi:MAG: hypothetical protein AAF311_02460 [Pseudomonadota bacterium]
MSIRFLLLASVLSAGLSACASVPLTSMPKLMGLSVETVDPGALEMAVIVPDTVGVRPGSAILSFTVRDDDTGESLDLNQIVDMPVEALDPVLSRASGPGQHVHRFRLSDEAATALEAYRSEALAFREARAGTKGSLSARVGFCRLDGTRFPDTVPMTIFVRTKPGQDFFRLLRTQRLDMEDHAATMNASEEHLCPDPEGRMLLDEMEAEKG